jgi:pimeloyl-ACP methyl ester carboxylesterase
MEEFIQFESGGETLLGVWTAPEANARPETVITLHGWGGYRIGPHRFAVKLCRALAQRGVSSLRFDFRGRGDSTGAQSAITLDMMIEDTRRAIEIVRAKAPANRMTLWGLCSGSNVAIGAATLERDVKNLVLLSCLPFMQQKTGGEKVARTKAQAGNYFRKLFRAATWKKLVTGAVNFGAVRKALFGHYAPPRDALRDPKDSARDIMAEFASFAGRAHFIYGGADREAALAGAHYRAFCDEHRVAATFETIEGSNHDFYALAWERQVIERTLKQVTSRAE